MLNPPFAAPGGVGSGASTGGDAWAAEVQRLSAWSQEAEPIGLLDWALLEEGADVDGGAGAAVTVVRARPSAAAETV